MANKPKLCCPDCSRTITGKKIKSSKFRGQLTEPKLTYYLLYECSNCGYRWWDITN